MTKTLLPIGNCLVKTERLGQIVAATLVLGLAVTFGSTNIAHSQNILSSTLAQSQPSTPSNMAPTNATQRLVGQWRLVPQ